MCRCRCQLVHVIVLLWGVLRSEERLSKALSCLDDVMEMTMMRIRVVLDDDVQGMKIDSEKELATYLVRVKEEEDSDKLISLVHKHKSHGKE
eukprot:447030-Hanusia_phi.AAC.7